MVWSPEVYENAEPINMKTFSREVVSKLSAGKHVEFSTDPKTCVLRSLLELTGRLDGRSCWFRPISSWLGFPGGIAGWALLPYASWGASCMKTEGFFQYRKILLCVSLCSEIAVYTLGLKAFRFNPNISAKESWRIYSGIITYTRMGCDMLRLLRQTHTHTNWEHADWVLLAMFFIHWHKQTPLLCNMNSKAQKDRRGAGGCIMEGGGNLQACQNLIFISKCMHVCVEEYHDNWVTAWSQPQAAVYTALMTLRLSGNNISHVGFIKNTYFCSFCNDELPDAVSLWLTGERKRMPSLSPKSLLF